MYLFPGKCQVQNENSQIPNSANKSSKYNIWGRDWMNWAEGVNGPAGGVKPKWFQIADRYMTNFMNNNAANGTSSQGGFFTKLFDKYDILSLIYLSILKQYTSE